ncbi:ATP phosphoribosyltransferase regulatory subunit [Terrisporobacter glycolicus]|uniref:ATP phosphoribosyltransferase regulatory subunit n=1 Tax=Terrisporobacter glycolicus ATCC 14880 = DSM 1288 TaxID=1121315 RepID=A0ABZ2EUX5_9FIRM|nr:ATP phosphoribosyltransferase regulatory subunit [Terrisporobacter glycolicus]
MKYLSIENELNYSKKRYEFTKEIEYIFVKNNYIQIKPSIFEDYDNFTSINKRIPTESMVKVVNDKILVLRPDITTSIIKSLIPKWEDNLVLKLFYHSTVYKNENKEGIKEIRQFGCEYLGEKSIKADSEIVNMSLDILKKFGGNFILEIGSSNYINGLLGELNIKEYQENKLKNLILRKNKIELRDYIEKYNINEEIKEIIYNLFELNGGIDQVISKARKFYTNDLMNKGLKELEEISILLKKSEYKKYTNCDLSMVGKFDYYEGIMIKGYYANVYKEILSGGRYDSLTEEFGKRVPAIGFCIDVDGLMEASKR